LQTSSTATINWSVSEPKRPSSPPEASLFHPLSQNSNPPPRTHAPRLLSRLLLELVYLCFVSWLWRNFAPREITMIFQKI
jgi:hypothetical protein